MGMSMGSASGGGGRRGGRRKAVMAEINVTPMVDVMLVLLIIFMVAAPLLTVNIQVDLPHVRPKEGEKLPLCPEIDPLEGRRHRGRDRFGRRDWGRGGGGRTRARLHDNGVGNRG